MLISKNPFLIWLVGMMAKLEPDQLECGDEAHPSEYVLGTISPETLRIMAVSYRLTALANENGREITRIMHEKGVPPDDPAVAPLFMERQDLASRAEDVANLFWATARMELPPVFGQTIAFRRGGVIVFPDHYIYRPPDELRRQMERLATRTHTH